MSNRTLEEARNDKGEDEQLRGAFYSVLFVGGFILVLWFIILAIFLVRQGGL